ncbi:MAG: serpin [Chloroflexota bacterium]|jgi:serpin B|nr:serpin [Chloroflexota bacterium]
MRVLAVIVAILAIGCSQTTAPLAPSPTDNAIPQATGTSNPSTTPPPALLGEIAEFRSQVTRSPATQEGLDALAEMVAGDKALAFNLYQYLAGMEDGNVFLSPYSISTALSMVLAGAREETAAELAAALGATDLGEDWHAARNNLELLLDELSQFHPTSHHPDGVAVPLTLEPTNAIVGQSGYPFQEDFLDILATDYGAGMNALDISSDPEAARVAINAWVAEKTHDRIEELLNKDSIDTLTRAVLVNAIYFKGNWTGGFKPSLTGPAPFHLLDGSTVDVPMMHNGGGGTSSYAIGDGWQAARLSYYGGASMLMIVPDEGHYSEIEGKLNSDFLAEVDGALDVYTLNLDMPKWETNTRFDVIPAMQELGVSRLFDQGTADLTGIADIEQLYISGVVHQANITVDEEGTEAAAATAAVVEAVSGHPSASLTIDRPFIYLIRAGDVGEILFMGRVLQP